MNTDPREILRGALIKRADGASEEGINAQIAFLSDDEFKDIKSLQAWVLVNPEVSLGSEPGMGVQEQAPAEGGRKDIRSVLRGLFMSPRAPLPPSEQLPPEYQAAQARLSAGGGGSGGDFGAQFSGVFGDEIAGLMDGPAAGEALTQRQKDLDLLAPEASALARLASLALPGFGGAMATRGAIGLGASPALAGAIGGGTAAGTAGFASGMAAGEGDLGERARGAIVPGLFSAGAGAGLGAVAGRMGSSATRPRSTRNARVAGRLRSGTGVMERKGDLLNDVDQMKFDVQRTFYGPLEDAHPRGSVSDPGIDDVLKDVRGFREGRTALKNAEAEVTARRRLSTPRGDLATGNVDPGFEDLQKLRANLLSSPATAGEGERLTRAMNDVFPEYRPGNRLWRRSELAGEAVQDGWKMYRASADEIAEAMRKYGRDNIAADAFRRSRVARVAQSLERLEEGGAAVMKELMMPGNPMRESVDALFPDQLAAQGFRNFMRNERSAVAIQKAFKDWGGAAVRLTGFGATAGAVGGAVGLFGSGN